MLSISDENEYRINGNYRLIFSKKITYLNETIEKLKNDLIIDDDNIEDEFWAQHNVDQVDLTIDDFEFYNSLCVSYIDKYKHFPQILYKSLLVSIYSIIETTLSELVKSTEDKLIQKIKFRDLKNVGSEIENYLNFFKLLHDIDVGNFKEILDELKNYTDIRNNIVHYNGNLLNDNESRKQRILAFSKINEYITIENDQNLYINDYKFLTNFLNLTEKFGYKLFEVFLIKPDN